MEQIDILTSDGEPTGTSADRSIVHAKGYWHRTVHVWMRNAAGDLLFQRRSLTKETHPDLWDISCAGHLSAGDTSVEGAVREAYEELGLHIDASKLVYLFTLRQHWESPDASIVENEIKDIYLYDFPVNGREITVDLQEVSGFRFISLQHVKNELVINKTQFVPHDEEYRRLLEYLNCLSANQPA